MRPVAHRTDEERRYQREYRRRYRAEGRQKPNTEEQRLRRRLLACGVTREQWDDAMLRQDGKCAICHVAHEDRRLRVDHCHETGAFRGLLCNACNTGLGKLGDDEAGLLRALAYLRRAV